MITNEQKIAKAYDGMTPVERAMFAKAAHEQFMNQEALT